MSGKNLWEFAGNFSSTSDGNMLSWDTLAVYGRSVFIGHLALLWSVLCLVSIITYTCGVLYVNVVNL